VQLAGTPDFVLALRQLLAEEPVSDGVEAAGVGSRAATACQQLSRQVARLLGELGTRTLFDRAMHLAASAYPWLATSKGGPAGDPYEGLRLCLDQPSATALPAAEHVIITYVELLERFIGTALVTSLVHEAWPTLFPSAPKEIS